MYSKNSFQLLADPDSRERGVRPCLPNSSKESELKEDPLQPDLAPASKLFHEQNPRYFSHHGARLQGGRLKGREFDRHSGTGRWFENKKSGAGKGNWGLYSRPLICADQITQTTEVDFHANITVVDDPEDVDKDVSLQSHLDSKITFDPNRKEEESMTMEAFMREQAKKEEEVADVLAPVPLEKVKKSTCPSEQCEAQGNSKTTNTSENENRNTRAGRGGTAKKGTKVGGLTNTGSDDFKEKRGKHYYLLPNLNYVEKCGDPFSHPLEHFQSAKSRYKQVSVDGFPSLS